MPMLPFGEYRPDVSDYNTQVSQTIRNVVPSSSGYAPFKALTAYSGAAADTCRGYFFARKNDGSVSVFAGTSTKLYNLNNTTQAWADVSKGATTYSALSSNAQWQFAQFNQFVFAVQQNAPVQVFNLTSSTEFADLGGSPPQASYVSVVNRFLVLSGLAAPNSYRVQWSDLNDTTNWSSGQADFQDLADGGIVRGVSGGEFGVIFQDQSIRRMTYAPGSPYVFGIDRISIGDGLYGPYSLLTSADRTFFCSPQGFKMLLPGGYPTPIGKEKVDATFFADVDTGNLQLLIGAADPTSTRVYWAYKSNNGATGLFDKILCYDWALNKWTPLTVTGEYIASLAKPGVTLEGVDSAYGSNIDTLTISSLDDISTASVSQLSAFGSDHKMGFFTGANLEATLRTSESGQIGQRLMITGFRPITDAATCYGAITSRETLQNSVSVSSESLVNSVGMCPQLVSTRYARGQIRIPAGTTWTYATGVEPSVESDGEF